MKRNHMLCLLCPPHHPLSIYTWQCMFCNVHQLKINFSDGQKGWADRRRYCFHLSRHEDGPEGKIMGHKRRHTVTCCTQGRFENGELVRGQMCELIGCYEVLYPHPWRDLTRDSSVRNMTSSFLSSANHPVRLTSLKHPQLGNSPFQPPQATLIQEHCQAPPAKRSFWGETLWGKYPFSFPDWQYLGQVGESLLPQGGEGLFAKKDLAAKEVASLYNGIKVKSGTYASEHLPRWAIPWNTEAIHKFLVQIWLQNPAERGLGHGHPKGVPPTESILRHSCS